MQCVKVRFLLRNIDSGVDYTLVTFAIAKNQHEWTFNMLHKNAFQ